MTQAKQWEREYSSPQFVTKNDKPQKFMLRFLKFLKKSYAKDFGEESVVLDLGCGVGRNSNYLASLGLEVFGLDVSPTALRIASERAREKSLAVKYFLKSIGEKYDFSDNYFDLVIDATSSSTLAETERETYFNESKRVLRTNGFFFVRALCKDGDKNAKKLLKLFPGKEKDTYLMPETGLIERVFSQSDFEDFYSQGFKIIKLIKESGYSVFNNKKYKRNFWIAYLQKTE